MKLSKLSTDQAADVLLQLTPSVANITGDKALLDTLKEKTGGTTVAEMYAAGAKKVTALAPILLKDHREDVFGVLAVLNECEIEEIAAQNIMQTIKQVREAVMDKDLRDFFESLRQEEGTE